MERDVAEEEKNLNCRASHAIDSLFSVQDIRTPSSFLPANGPGCFPLPTSRQTRAQHCEARRLKRCCLLIGQWPQAQDLSNPEASQGPGQ